jgi:hypothetical protein
VLAERLDPGWAPGHAGQASWTTAACSARAITRHQAGRGNSGRVETRAAEILEAETHDLSTQGDSNPKAREVTVMIDPSSCCNLAQVRRVAAGGNLGKGTSTTGVEPIMRHTLQSPRLGKVRQAALPS